MGMRFSVSTIIGHAVRTVVLRVSPPRPSRSAASALAAGVLVALAGVGNAASPATVRPRVTFSGIDNKKIAEELRQASRIVNAKGMSASVFLATHHARQDVPRLVEILQSHGHFQPKNRTSQALPLDINLSIPARCFLRGRGLDSEWSGELHGTGTDKEPKIRGEMNLVRGHATILTKRFDLEKGKVTFAGQAPPSPLLDIHAVDETPDLRVNLHVTGPATNIELTLSSVPSLPRDEILSRLLFGRALDEITPQMAVKLALAVRTLTTGKMGLLQRLRSGLGLDTLELKTSEGDQPETVVGVGKYLGEDIYFQVERGMAGDSTQMSVEVELTRHPSIESQAGALNQGIKLKWRYRY